MLNTAIPLSFTEKLDFLPALVSLCLTIVWAMFTGFWRSSSHPKSWLLHVGYAAFRKATRRLSVAQMQYVMPPTNKIYDQYVRKAKKVADTVDLGHGALGHWVGDRNADNVLIWYHGGGFALPANLGYFHFFARLIADSARANKSLAVFGLTYTLAPQATYPTQLRQAVEGLRYVVEQTKRSPGQILLGGDSAGGNLVGGVLSHLAHPHPAIGPVDLSEHLRGAVMIAPWTSMETDYSTQPIDSRGDLITPAVAGPWASAYLGTSKRDYYTDLSTAPTDWYTMFPVKKVLVCAGGSEILYPIIQEFVAKFKEGFPDVEFCVGHREGHVAPIYNLYIGDQTETEQGKRVKSWLRETL
ncbi:Alpha/Beta hydrolase protein [Aspergillus leporis]|uniref:Alpha/Beta hydrolase protein n=1 Tax=Aspergillus leporis TaxID=41062 RepID=A0A5N5XG25_9EURO|nr:Alpha/Beta hydrolase protein [Aspergillus leporis]